MLFASMVPEIHIFCEFITVPALRKLVYQEDKCTIFEMFIYLPFL